MIRRNEDEIVLTILCYVRLSYSELRIDIIRTEVRMQEYAYHLYGSNWPECGQGNAINTLIIVYVVINHYFGMILILNLI